VNAFWETKLYRWIVMTLVFGIVPSILYPMLIHPPIMQIYNAQNRLRLLTKHSSQIHLGPAPATNQELEQLEQIRQNWLSRIKEINNRESLLRFTSTLTDALAVQARQYGLHVISADLQSSLIRGKYVPANEQALDTLTALPSPEWKELTVPLDLPMLHLPSIEICMTVSGNYSQVFSFIESLPDFPAQVNLTGLGLTQDQEERAFQLKIRGYYHGSDRGKPSTKVKMANSASMEGKR
jgi:hypothetical protein